MRLDKKQSLNAIIKNGVIKSVSLVVFLLVCSFKLVFTNNSLFLQTESGAILAISDKDEIAKHNFYPLTKHRNSLNKLFHRELFVTFREKDHIEITKEIQFLDGSNSILFQHELEIKYGQNYLRINLDMIPIEFEYGAVFTISIDDSKFTFTPIEEPELPSLNIAIEPEPISIDCDLPEKAEFNFTASVSSGSPPYKVSWMVFQDESLQNLLYAPNNATLNRSGESSLISVRALMDFTVVFTVLDACDNYEERILNMKCQSGEDNGINFYFENYNNHSNSVID